MIAILSDEPERPGLRDFDLFLASAGIEIVPVDAEQARVARDAFRRYGKGRHPAALNFGDCFSYALAKTTGLPLLFKGRDFQETDILSARNRSNTKILRSSRRFR